MICVYFFLPSRGGAINAYSFPSGLPINSVGGPEPAAARMTQPRRRSIGLNSDDASKPLPIGFHLPPAKSLQTISSSAAEPIIADGSNAAAS